jgi:hypothetical protein
MIYYLSSQFCTRTQEMRFHRDQLLSQSDWAMATDAPTDKTEWATYRQALRDFPATWEEADTANFPEAPA